MDKQLASEIRISSEYRSLIGEYADLPFINISGGTGHERIIKIGANLEIFNEALKSGNIQTLN